MTTDPITMHNEEPSTSPRQAAADLVAVQALLEGLAVASEKRGRPLKVSATPYSAEDMVTIARRVGQIVEHFDRERTGQKQHNKEARKEKQAADKKATKKATEKAAKKAAIKKAMATFTPEERPYLDELDKNLAGKDRIVLASRLAREAWPLIVSGDLDVQLAQSICQHDGDYPSNLPLARLRWCFEEQPKEERFLRRQGVDLHGEAFVELVDTGTPAERALEILNPAT